MLEPIEGEHYMALKKPDRARYEPVSLTEYLETALEDALEKSSRKAKVNQTQRAQALAEVKNQNDWKVVKPRSKRNARANKSTAVWGSSTETVPPVNQNHGTHAARRSNNRFACLETIEPHALP